MVRNFDYTQILGWSLSRYERFLLCKRQYYYEYYGDYDKEYPKEKITFLEGLTSIPLEVGSIVHDVIRVLLERLLKTQKAIDIKRFWDFTNRKTIEICQKKTFSEVYYKEVDRIDTNELFKDIQNTLQRFLESPRFNWLIKKAISSKERWLIEPSGYGEARLNGMKVYCKVDFLFPLNDEIYIIDWKTGKRSIEKHKKQLLGYVSWASYHLKKDPAKIVPIIVYLRPSYDELLMRFNEYDLQDLRSR